MFPHQFLCRKVGSIGPGQPWEVGYIREKKEGKTVEKGGFSEKLDLGLLYISSSSSAWDSLDLLAQILPESKNCYFWTSEFLYLFPYGQSWVIDHTGFNYSLKGREFSPPHC